MIRLNDMLSTNRTLTTQSILLVWLLNDSKLNLSFNLWAFFHLNKHEQKNTLRNETAVIEREKEQNRNDFDRLVNSCVYTRTVPYARLDQITHRRHKIKISFSISARLFIQEQKKQKKYKKKKTTCTYT